MPYLQVALDNGGAGSILNVWNGVGTGPSYNGTPGVAAGVSSGWKTCSNTNCHYALSPSWSGKKQVGGLAFPATTYIVHIDSGTPLGWVSTNMTSGTGKIGQGDNTLLVLSGEATAATDYGAANTTPRTAFNAIWNTALGAGSNTTITGVTFNIYLQKANAADRVRLLLQSFNPSGGAATTIYDTGLVDPGGPVGSTAPFTHASPALAAAVPDGRKLGVTVNFQQGSVSSMRVYAATGTAGQNARVTISGSSATGAAPAPPRTTGDEAAIACNSCHQFGPDDATAGYKDGNQYYYDLPGSHAKHGYSLIAGNDPSADNALDSCTLCHPSEAAAYGSDHLDGLVDVRLGTIGTRIGSRAYADDGTYDEATRSCANVYCHAGRPTPQAAGKSWGYGASVCGQCHAVTPPYGKHGVHNAGNVSTTPSNGTTASAYDFSCYYCHPSGAAHVNYPVSAAQAADVSFAGTLGTQTLGGTYAAGGAAAGWDNVTGQGLSWSNGSCATYCHSNGRGGAALVTPTWNHSGFPSASCAGCHDTGGSATTLSARHGKHTDNTAGTGYGFTCDECHALTVANDSRTLPERGDGPGKPRRRQPDGAVRHDAARDDDVDRRQLHAGHGRMRGDVLPQRRDEYQERGDDPGERDPLGQHDQPAAVQLLPRGRGSAFRLAELRHVGHPAEQPPGARVVRLPDVPRPDDDDREHDHGRGQPRERLVPGERCGLRLHLRQRERLHLRVHLGVPRNGHTPMGDGDLGLLLRVPPGDGGDEQAARRGRQ